MTLYVTLIVEVTPAVVSPLHNVAFASTPSYIASGSNSVAIVVPSAPAPAPMLSLWGLLAALLLIVAVSAVQFSRETCDRHRRP